MAALVTLALAGLCGHHLRRVTEPATSPTFAAYPYLGGLHPMHAHTATHARAARGVCGFDHAVQAGVPNCQLVDLDSRLVTVAALLPMPPGETHRVAIIVAAGLFFAGMWISGRLLGGAWAGVIALAAAYGWCWWGPGAAWLRDGYLTRIALLGVVPMQLAVWERSRGGWSPRLLAAAALTHAVGFSLHPPLWLGLLAAETLFWLGAGRRATMCWTFGHAITLLVAAVAAWPTAAEWWRFWWIRSPLIEHGLTDALHDRAFLDRWPGVRGKAYTLAAFAAAALVYVSLQRLTPAYQRGRRLIVFGLLVLGGAVVWAAAIVPGVAPPGLTALAATCFTAAYAGLVVALLRRSRDDWRILGTVIGAAVVTAGFGANKLVTIIRAVPPPDTAGIAGAVSPDAEALVAAIASHTQPTARIVWEEHSTGSSRWDRLLPELTGRAFIGTGHFDGLECDAITLRDGHLGGRNLDHWLDEELTTYCKRLNVGWVVARTPASVARWAKLPGAYAAARATGDEWVLFQLARPHAWCLRGTAAVNWQPGGRLELLDAKPEQGAIVLSLHYQDGIVIEPHGVRAEPEPDPSDPVPLIRLRLTGPYEHVTIRWKLP